MKKKNIIYWAVALVLVLVTAYSTVHVHNARQVNDVKMQSESRKQAEEDAQQKRLLADQKKRLIKPASWDKPTLSGGYPDISKYAHAKKKEDRIWIEVNLRKQRVYIRRGPYTLYTMYASVGKNYEKAKDYQRTPIGHFKIEKRRGTSYYDPTRGYGARYWTAFKDDGLYRFESVPFDENGKVIKAEAEKLGQKVTKKHNIKAYGSIRLSVPDAQWIEENIPAKTRVVIDSQDDKRDAWEYLKVD